ncbi:MAG TPA: hypothetical protein VMU55_05690 [Solirubrobacteraceae bacterium]|nr:hypothetical protein [Solirubrobacteraceae bacterium]
MSCLTATILGAASEAPIWTSKVGAIAAGVTATVALLALLGTVRQLRQTRAHHYLQRYDEPQLLPYIVKTHAVIKDDGTVSTRIAKWDKMSFAEQLDVLLFLNFWEELASMYNRKLVDRKIVAEWFGDAAIAYWQMAEWLVLHQRKELPEDGIYSEWETMCAHIKRRRAA